MTGCSVVDPVTFNVKGRSLQATVNDAKARVAALKLPPGVYVEFSGAAAAAHAAQLQMLIYTGFCVAADRPAAVHLLQLAFNTWLVLLNLPFSLIGSVLAIVLTGGGVSVGAMVGLVTVFGISARNAILLLSHYEHLVEAEGVRWVACAAAARRSGTAGADLDDGGGDGAGPVAIGAGHEPARPGNRRPDGGNGAGRTCSVRPC